VITVELLDDVAPVTAEWDALVNRLGASPFLGPDWIAAHWAAFGAGRLRIVTARRDGQLGAVLALIRHRHAARSVTNEQTPEFGLLAQDDELAGQALTAMTSRGVSRVEFAYVDPEDALARAFYQRARTRRELTAQRVMLRSPYIEIDRTFADYRAGLKSSFRGDLRRRGRRLAERGEVQLDVRDGSEGLDAVLATGWELETSEWKERLGTAVAARASTRNFYTDIARRSAERDRLRLYFLRLDGAPIAFMFGLQQSGALYLLKGGFDRAYAPVSPGQLLVERVIEHAFSARLNRIELLGSDEMHKVLWATGVRERLLLQSFGRSPVRRAQWVAQAYGRPLALRIAGDQVLRPLRDRARVITQTVRKINLPRRTIG
jgi:CelD/BcsL family acetyltransferase involved in cellulose biosynthesis